MKLLIGIATYKRPKKLIRLIKSLNNQTYKDFRLYIISDNNDFDSANIVQTHEVYDVMNTSWIVQNDSKHHYVIGAWNRVIKENINRDDWDGFIGLCDDVELRPNALEEIINYHQKCFPDTDGVCGFNQECPGHLEYTFKWFGQTLMGRKFVERYKDVDYQICCPYYTWSHQDEEMFQFASSLNKFRNCETAILQHYHPCFIKQEIDETHNILRQGNNSIRNKDLTLFKKRQEENKIWGKTWEQ